MALIDLYVGLALFAGWIALRERRPAAVLPWLVALAVFGNLASAFYALWAAGRSETIPEFLSGRSQAPNV